MLEAIQGLRPRRNTLPPLPPGPAAPPLVQAVRFGSDPQVFLSRCAAEFGETFTMRLPGDPPRVVLSAPADVKAFFALRPDVYRSDLQSLFLPLGPESLLYQDNARHGKQRRLITPFLHGKMLNLYAEQMDRATNEILETWPRGTPLKFFDRIQEITMRVIVDCVFGAVSEQRRARYQDLVPRWLAGVLTPGWAMVSMLVSGVRLRGFFERQIEASLQGQTSGPEWLPWRRPSELKADLIREVRADIQQLRRGGGEDRNDVMAMMIRAEYEDGEPMTEADIVDQLVTLMAGGHETTASTLSWTMHHLLQHPRWLERCAEEARRVLGSGGFEAEDLSKMPVLNACIDESMRLTPIAPATSRTLAQDKTIGGWDLPEGTVVWASNYLTGRRPDLWPDPTAFRPERFLEEGAVGKPTTLYPFGGGRRRCVGMAFARMEMQIVLGRLLLCGGLRPGGAIDDKAVFRGVAITPADGVPLVLA